jgi:hypothetical protein
MDPAQKNLSTTAYVVSGPDYSNAVSEWQQANVLFKVGSATYASIESLQTWTIPWLTNRLILGRLARWKALYLLNAFDGVWAVLQALERLVTPDPPVVPPTMKLKQDGTIASGNWSARELCSIVEASGTLLTANGYVSKNNGFVINWAPDSPIVWTPVSGCSVGGLLDFLYNVANGNWAAPPDVTADRSPPRPLSFRALLAAAAT